MHPMTCLMVRREKFRRYEVQMGGHNLKIIIESIKRIRSGSILYKLFLRSYDDSLIVLINIQVSCDFQYFPNRRNSIGNNNMGLTPVFFFWLKLISSRKEQLSFAISLERLGS